ncbi:reverse transcriptase domain-containing protein [Tanacetum coccineum]
MTLELANREIYTPVRIARDVFLPVGRFTFPTDFVIFNYESDPRVPIILGRPFLRTARALIDVHGEEMILRDGDERLILNMRHDTSSYSNKPEKESINMIDIYNVSHKDYLEDLFANEKITNHQSGNPTFSSHTDLTAPKVINPLSGNPTPILDPIVSSFPIITSFKESDLIWEEFKAYLARDSFPPGNGDPVDLLLEEFTDELALITFLQGNYDLPFDIESDLREIEYLLNHDLTKERDSILEDSVDEGDKIKESLNLDGYELESHSRSVIPTFPPVWTRGGRVVGVRVLLVGEDGCGEERWCKSRIVIIEYFSSSLIPVEDSDSLMEEINIYLAPDDSIPPGIENDDYDSEGDILFFEELLINNSISLLEYESFHIDFYNVPSSPRPPEKPPDDDVYFDIEPDTIVLDFDASRARGFVLRSLELQSFA